MDKAAVAAVLEEIAVLMELKGENPFKIRAYQNGARALLNSNEDLDQLVRDNQLTSIKGIGKGLSENISTLVTTGSLPIYEELKKELEPGLIALTRLQGVGPKKAVLLHQALGIKSVDDLKKAAEAGKIAALKGFGKASQDNILKSIGFFTEHSSEHLIDVALETAQRVIEPLRRLPAVKEISVAGSLRRCREIVRDVDILVSADKGAAAIMKTFVTLPGVQRILGQGETKSSVQFQNGMQVDLRVVKSAAYPTALHYFTGSKEHNIVMRQRAIERNLKLNEYGLETESGKTITCRDEEDLFKKLGLSYIPPELRENRGEFEAAANGTLPMLIASKDIRGVFHVHSTWSDGTVELESMIAEAERMGFEYVGISDHSQVAGYAGGLSIDRVKQQGKVIEGLRKKFKIRIFWGSECDILKEGEMDYNEAVLSRYDFVIASVHSAFHLPEPEQTARIQRALSNKHVTILGHPTGRLLGRRPSYQVNMKEILKTAASEGVAVEINALADRLELDWRDIPQAQALGCRFSLNPDAHSIEDLHGYPRAVGIARKGWLTASDVINALPLAKMESYLKARKKR